MAANTSKADSEEQTQIAKLEKTLDELKLMYEHENQEAFSLNFKLFNDNLNLKEKLKETVKDYNELLDDFNTQTEIIENLKQNLKLKTNEIKELKSDLAEHSRSQTLIKRINKNLNNLGLNTSMTTNRSSSAGGSHRRNLKSTFKHNLTNI